MERETQRKYPIFETLSTEELEKLLAQDFAADDGDTPDVDYIMAIMEVIHEREKAAGHSVDVDAAWNDFQENYQGQSAAFEHSLPREAESSNHLSIPPVQAPRKKKYTLRFVAIAAVIVVLLCGTASGFGRVFQAVVSWTAETFGFESPYGESSADVAVQEDPYINLRTVVSEHTDLAVVPKWAPDGTVKAADSDVKITYRKDSTHLEGFYQTADGDFVIRVRVHHDSLPNYTFVYQWNETELLDTHTVAGLEHDIARNNENYVAAWTNENIECIIQGALSIDELVLMIDSIYQE